MNGYISFGIEVVGMEWYDRVLPVENKLEYVFGDVEVLTLEKGALVEAKGKRAGVAEWVGGRYRLWVWDGKVWKEINDVRGRKLNIR